MYRSIVLDFCWVCGCRFTDSDPPGTEVRHDHHLVPQAYGGKDGPTVTLDDSCHNTLHHIAVAWKASKPHFKYIQGKDPEIVKKLEFLASIVYNAELQSRGDPNKIASVLLHLNARQKHQVDSLKKIYSKRGRQDIFYLALENLYNKHFTN